MRFKYESQGTNTYLVYQITAEDTIDTLSLGMLTNNSIPGCAAVSFMQMDLSKYVKYNVSAKVPAAQMFNGPVNKKRLLGVFRGIVDAMLSAEDYMLEPGSFVLDLDYIFVDVTTCETVLICLPLMLEGQEPVDLGRFFKDIIFRTKFDQTENCDHVAQIINYLNGSTMLIPAEFKAVLDSLDKAPAEPPKAEQRVPYRAEPDRPVVKVTEKERKPDIKVEQPKVPVQNPGQQHTTPEVLADKPVQKAEEDKGRKLFGGLFKGKPKQEEPKKEKKDKEQDKKDKKGGAKPASTPKPLGFAVPGQTPAIPRNDDDFKPKESAPERPAETNKRDFQPAVPQPTHNQAKEQEPGKRIQFGETTVLGGGNSGATTVLIGGDPGVTTLLGVEMGAPAAAPYLIREKNGERIPVNKPVFRVGKERSYVDYFVGDNTAVSRSHANIITKDGGYFIMDTNSSNHTFVNGTMIPSMVEVAIASGDKIRLANEDFTFQVM